MGKRSTTSTIYVSGTPAGTPVSGAGGGGIRYDSASAQWVLSSNAGAWVPITTGTATAVWQKVGTDVSLIDPAGVDNVTVEAVTHIPGNVAPPDSPILELGTPGYDPGDGVPVLITLPTRDATKVWSVVHAPFVSQATDNYVLQVGFNAGGDGQNLNPAYPSLFAQWESSFVNGPGGPTLSEWHIIYLNAGGGSVQRRPLTIAVDQGTDLADIAANGKFTVSNTDLSVRRFFIPESAGDVSAFVGSNVAGGGVGFIFDRNNVVALQQRGAGAYYCQMARVDGADNLLLGGANVSNVYLMHVATPRVRTNVDGVGISSAVVESAAVPGSRDPSAILEARSTTQGFLPPRMTTAQRDAIAAPAAGLMIYNTTTNKLNVFTTAWEQVTSA